MNQRNNRGTTLIEVLVVVIIASILLGAAFLEYRKRSQELALQRASHTLLAEIEKTRETAMSGRPLADGEAPEGGYGLYFNTDDRSGYIVFADEGPSPNHLYNSGEEVEIIFFEENIELHSVSPDNPLNIVFIPPSPDVFINASNLPLTEAEITLRLKNDFSKRRTIKVNSAGLIFME